METPNIFRPEDGYTVVVWARRFKVGEYVGNTAWKCVKRVHDKDAGYGYAVMFDGSMAKKLKEEGIDQRNGSREKLPEAFATAWLF